MSLWAHYYANMQSLEAEPISHKKSSPTLSTFAPSKILPANEDIDVPNLRLSQYPPKEPRIDYQDQEGNYEQMVEEEDSVHSRPHKHDRISALDRLSSYDLAPPPPLTTSTNAEVLADRLFSADHLDLILKDPTLSHRFTSFLNEYKSHCAPTLVRYLESQKALTAVKYANTLASSMTSSNKRRSSNHHVAVVDHGFEARSRRAVDELLTEALPAYLTYRMVQVVTECLVKEITGTNTPMMKDLVQGLAEVYCMTDPSLPDNPIVFASEEFYNTTQYGREYVIGKNCRFLQGPKTQTKAVHRISEALHNQKEVCEILLNYKRDGTPFLNLVMMAPLLDNRGNVRYFIGCQIDISHLIAGGKALESFRQLLLKDEAAQQEKPLPDPLDRKPPLKVLRELGQMLNDEEVEIVRMRGRSDSIDSEASTPTRPAPQRRYVGMEESNELPIWGSPQYGPSGRLPGVYQNYLLVRPYPSLRIIFTSPALRIPGLSQSRLLDRIGGPTHVRDALLDALSNSIGVTAKISWLTSPRYSSHTTNSNGGSSGGATDHGDVTGAGAGAGAGGATNPAMMLEGKPRWIHCTPLLGSDTKVGVWMVVMVEKEEVTGTLNRHQSSRSLASSTAQQRIPYRAGKTDLFSREGWPLRGVGAGGGAASARFTSNKLYAEYLRRQGRTESPEEVGVGAGVGAAAAALPAQRSRLSQRSEGSRRSASAVRGGVEPWV